MQPHEMMDLINFKSISDLALNFRNLAMLFSHHDSFIIIIQFYLPEFKESCKKEWKQELGRR